MKKLRLTAVATLALALGVGGIAQAHDDHMPDWTGWTPGGHDTCAKADHDQASVIGPDGLAYTTWHAPKGDTGCTYGHEHGDDPRTSKIYDWVREKLAADGHADRAGLPFGFVSHASQVYEEAGGGHAHRHEDHPGHKVIVLNDVKLVHADRTQGFVKDAAGKPVVCHYLMKMHQGSHSPDATRNNAHELIYAMRCSNGAEAVVSTLTKLGRANEFHANCDETPVATSGSNLPGQDAGRRLLPTAACVTKYPDVWGTYETWETDTTLTAPDGHELIHFDPWFGVRNPSRVWDAGTGKAIPTVSLRPAITALDAVPWYRLPEAMEKDDPASAFTGAKRDVYVGATRIANAGGPTTWYTDPYGGHASTEPFPGSVKQYIAPVSIDTGEVERQVFGWNTDYGPAGSGVHAPN